MSGCSTAPLAGPSEIQVTRCARRDFLPRSGRHDRREASPRRTYSSILPVIVLCFRVNERRIPIELLPDEIERDQRKGRPSRMSLRRTTLAACVGGLAALGIVPFAAGAPTRSWSSRAEEARTACAAGEVAKGTRLLAKLYATTKDPIWIFNQGRCFQKNGEPVQALARFREYLRKAKTAPKDSEAASGVSEAEGYVKELGAKIAAQNEKPAPSEAAPPAPVAAEPAASEPPVPSPPPATPTVASTSAPRPAEEQGQGLLVAGVGLEILGTAALVTGGVFSYLVHKTNRDANNLTGEGKVAQGADLRVKQADGKHFATMQWVFYGIGGAAAAAGITLHIIGTRKQSGGAKAELQPAVSPSAWGLSLSVRL